ncbi:hypothetical protein KUL118_57280 [Tenacibaculum sp. KUL118]|nr:hypothetical protein KUL118_57280 [Tenacibaculum sp. KUL118]
MKKSFDVTELIFIYRLYVTNLMIKIIMRLNAPYYFTPCINFLSGKLKRNNTIPPPIGIQTKILKKSDIEDS